MTADEAYDVVVVRDPTMTVGAIRMLSRDLAHLTGVKQADVELAMQKGRFVVYPALSGARVDAATAQLRAMGAVVQVKPSASADVGPEIEPADERALGVDDFGGSVAHFSDADLGLDSGAFNTGAGAKVAGLAPPPLFNQQRVPGGAAPLGRFSVGGNAEEARTSRYEPVPHNASLRHEDRSALGTGLHGVGPSEDDDMLALATGLDAASLESPSVQTIDGMDGDVFDAAEKAAAEDARPDPTSVSTQPVEDEELALDVSAPAGLTPVGPADGAVIRPQHLPEESLTLDRPAQSSAAMSSPSYATPRAPMSSPGMPVANMDLGERGLLFQDPVANTLALIAAACLVCVVVALGMTRATKREGVVGLEAEISESYRSPSDVQGGKQRAPATIQEELDDLYGSAKSQFLIVLALGIPVGLGLGRVRR